MNQAPQQQWTPRILRFGAFLCLIGMALVGSEVWPRPLFPVLAIAGAAMLGVRWLLSRQRRAR